MNEHEVNNRRRAILRRVLSGETMAEVAISLSISTGRVTQICHRALRDIGANGGRGMSIKDARAAFTRGDLCVPEWRPRFSERDRWILAQGMDLGEAGVRSEQIDEYLCSRGDPDDHAATDGPTNAERLAADAPAV